MPLTIYFFSASENDKSIVSRIEKEIHNGTKELQSRYELLCKDLNNDASRHIFEKQELVDSSIEENIIVLISKKDSLVYWNSNAVVLPDFSHITTRVTDTIVHLNNGYFQILYDVFQEYNICLLLPVFSDYSFENSYLENSFDQRFGSSAKKYIISDGLTTGIPIQDQAGRILFSISEKTDGAVPRLENFLIILLLIVWFISFNLLIYNLLNTNHGLKYTAIRILILIIAISVFRILLDFILKLSGLTIMDLLNYQTSGFGILFPNLFDFIMNSISLFFIALVFSKSGRKVSKQFTNKELYVNLIFQILSLIILFVLFVIVIEQIVYHSSISLFFSSLYSLKPISYLVLFIMTFISLSFFIFITRISASLMGFTGHRWKFVFFLMLGALSTLVIFRFVYTRSWLLPITCSAYFLLIFLYQNKTTFHHKLVFSLLGVALFSVIASAVYNQVNNKKADSNQTLTAYKLGLEKDPMFEFLYSEISDRIQTDSLVKEFLYPQEEIYQEDANLLNYLNNKYFTEYFESYNLSLTLCQPNEKLSVQPENFVVNCADYFDEIILNSGRPTEVAGLFYIDDNVQGSYYISRIQLSSGSAENGASLVLEFYNKFVPEGLGYPELLVDERKGISSEFSTYSFANYRDDVLVYKFGDFLFPARQNDFSNIKSGFFETAGYKHFVYPIDSQKTLIISRPLPSFQENLAPFSLFFLSLLLLTFITYIFFFVRRKELLNAFNFRLKLQLFIFSALMLSFAVFGIVSVAYIRAVYKQKNMDFLTERTQSILIELQQKMQNENLSNEESRDYLQQLLLKFSLIFFSDINLYATNGQLIGSSRPEIFTSGLMSDYMNQTAYYQMRHRRTMYYLQQEHIGKGTYYSSYIPLRDIKGNPIAYLNLPYFARESELRQEISGFVFAYLNIFLALTAISVAFALVLSRRLTKPMQLIQERMKSVRIDKVNEKILWKGNDELGQLVTQYNQLIDDLATSAGLLARSERESAWREMARQVAHEIKNPLTPMRLSVQYLQRAWDEGDPNIDDKLHRTTKTLVEQIDTLSEIASAFSDFAKMPDNQPEKTELSALLSNVVLLFNIEAGDRIRFVNHQQTPCYVFADPKNLSRAFNNLIKNAIQATINKEDGFVEVILKQQDSIYLVVVRDNGIGIPNEEKAKIFLPNFTTKSSGMGIGLSIVHHIISLSNGSITFETEEGRGTSFSVRIPLINR
jgi:signal transduction histidine kinase